jgi:2-oxoglutarate dehydrogenase E1 component
MAGVGEGALAASVAPSTRINRRIEPQRSVPAAFARTRAETAADDSSGALQALIAGYRLHGWRAAQLDPLDSRASDPSGVAELDPQTHGLHLDESIRYSVEFGGVSRMLALPELLHRLRTVYCGTTVLDCAHLRAAGEQRWLYAQLEEQSDALAPGRDEAVRILRDLVASEAFEHYRREKYPQHKQFSLEGGESLVTLLRTVIETAAQRGVQDIVLGMPHRGRLNLMLNALDVPTKQLFSLFSTSPDVALAKCDLRDHAGMWATVRTGSGDVRVLLAHNPSHLESVSPVVCGIARALQDRKGGDSRRSVMAVLVHGDASFSGQGIVPETLNLSQLRGYGTGGTLHLILNNQIGSTVSHPRDARSTHYCADLARAIDAPIVHVNADDPDAVAAVARIATEYRMTFGADFVVDHIGYRRHGHFGADDPRVTQPALQRRIRSHPSVAAIYGKSLAARGLDLADEAERMRASALAAMSEVQPGPSDPRASEDAIGAIRRVDAVQPSAVTTAIPLEQLQAIVGRLSGVPPRFALHSDVETLLGNWRAAVADGERAVGWCLAENLAYGSLLANGFNIRLTGLDVGRGSFFHRYHVWHDQAADNDWDAVHLPLRHVAAGQGAFSIFESPLSEEAVLGFEYGYSLQCGRDLVVWEAQFGDFVNNAQVIIDQYIASGESKWGYKSGLVMLLPHGHEGGGPEHSCAYLGRFLQLCAEANLRVAMPSTAAQLYHLLRGQALASDRKPLIVMTPKTQLYAQQSSFSRLQELASGEFHALYDECEEADPQAVRRVVVTSGKLYYDLGTGRMQAGLPDLPILRAEQLYPFPTEALAARLQRYPHLREVVWAQEEARNHGAWPFVRESIEAALPKTVSLVYAGRGAMPATAGCNPMRHAAEQRAVVGSALALAPS